MGGRDVHEGDFAPERARHPFVGQDRTDDKLTPAVGQEEPGGIANAHSQVFGKARWDDDRVRANQQIQVFFTCDVQTEVAPFGGYVSTERRIR